MEHRSPRTPIAAVLVRVALAALVLVWWMAPAAVDAAPAPVVAQAGPCGDKPCAESPPPGEGPCGATPCAEVPPGASACGDRPCGEVPVDQQSPCGDKPCLEEVPADQANPCGDRPCGEASAEDVNNPAAADPSATATTTAPGEAPGETPGQATPGQEGFRDGRAAQAIDGENAGSSSSGVILPLLFVALAGLALFWVVRRNRSSADSEA